MKKTLTLATVLISALLLCHCAALKPLLKSPTVHFQGMDVKDPSLFEGTILFHFEIDNPNPIGLPIDAVAYDLKLNGKDFFAGKTNKSISVPSKGSTTIDLPFKVKYLNLVESALEFAKKDDIAYKLNGHITVGPFQIPYAKEGTFSIPHLPKVSLGKAHVEKISILGASMMLSIELENDNPFAIRVAGIEYSVKLGGTPFASGSARGKAVSESGTATINLPIDIDFIQVGRAAVQLLKGASAEYELSGEIKLSVPKLGFKKFPFLKKGTIPLSR